MAERGIPAFVRPQVGPSPTAHDYARLATEVQKVAQAVDANHRPQLSSEVLEGNEARDELGGLKAIELLAADVNLVVHGLGRAVRGWRVVRIWGSAMVYEEPDSGEDLTKYLPLRTTADVLVRLEVW
jgi:hypothetical protein